MTSREIRHHHLSPREVAERAGVNVSALPFYERMGLIESTRTTGNQRRYHRDVLRRVAFIRVSQKKGISLSEIAHALASLPEARTPTKRDWARLSQRWRQTLEKRIAYLERLRTSLDGCIGCGCLSLKSCSLYNPDDVLGEDGPVRWSMRAENTSASPPPLCQEWPRNAEQAGRKFDAIYSDEAALSRPMAPASLWLAQRVWVDLHTDVKP